MRRATRLRGRRLADRGALATKADSAALPAALDKLLAEVSENPKAE